MKKLVNLQNIPDEHTKLITMPIPSERNQVTKESHFSLDTYFEQVKNLVYICYQQKKKCK